jgi:hypothetical protein
MLTNVHLLVRYITLFNARKQNTKKLLPFFFIVLDPAFAIQMTLCHPCLLHVLPFPCLPFYSLINATLHCSGEAVARLCADDGGSGFDTCQGLGNLMFSIASRLAPAPTHPLLNGYRRIFPPAYSGRGVNLTDVWISGAVYNEA